MEETSKKKRNTLTHAQKKALCEKYKNNPNLTHKELFIEFSIARSTVTDILSKSNEWFSIDETLKSSQNKRNR
jgi:CENP-B N-terminal DNA-binding domain